MGKREGFLRARRGAVLAEFAIAFMPICTMFLCLVQQSRYSVARLAALHAAQVSVRACAVIIQPNPGHDANLNGPDSDVQRAADIAMGPFEGSGEISHSPPTCTQPQGNTPENGTTDEVSMDMTYTCQVPVAQKIICPNGSLHNTFHAQFPHQGARYVL